MPDETRTELGTGGALAHVRAVADAVEDPVCVIDRHGRVLHANHALGQRLGQPADALAGERLGDLRPDLRATLEQDRARLLERGDDEAVRRSADAPRPYVLKPLADADGGVAAFVCVLRSPAPSPATGACDGAPAGARDAGPAGEPDDEAERLRRELKRANEDMQAFAYIASHDLQEPLRTISTCAAMLEKREAGRIDAKSREFLGYAIDGAKRMQRLIDALLVFSRIGTNSQPNEEVELERALELALEDLEPLLLSANAVITHDPLPVVRGSATMLAQLFHHLIDNAVKYRSDAAPRVHIACVQLDRCVEVSVTDNGIGIPAEFHQRVFGIFKRLHGRVKYPGSGAGLAIARRIVERHGGAIWVESAGDGGSTFRFTLAHEPPAPPATA